MNASIDKDLAGKGDDARAVLAGWLDDFSAGKCERADMQESFLSVCRSNTDASWDALALLDQYQRRGKVDAALVRELKAQIEQLAFGVAKRTQGSRDSTEATLDNTGSRWRKLMADRDPSGINRAPADDLDAEAREDEEEEDDVEPLRERPREAHADPKPRRPRSRPDPSFGAPVAKSAAPVSLHKPAPGVDGGRVLRDRYELISVIGRGSAGTVYRALDRNRAHLPQRSRCVAIKLLKQNLGARSNLPADLAQQFHQAQSLSHPNIVSVFDLDRDGDSYFLVMELLEGMLLSEVLRRLEGGPMTRDKGLAVIGAIGAALMHAHRHQVVHGDLKPRNVMITASGEVKVLDFGFARHEPLEPQAVEALQNELVMAASAPAYASMDRALGDPPLAGDDVYSLACMAYELLAGQHPYGGRSGAFGRSQGRRPKRISGLTHRQWYALSRALRPAREDRKIELVELLRGLGCLDLQPQSFTPHDLISREDGSRHLGRKIVIAIVLFGLSVGGVMYALQRIDTSGLGVSGLPIPMTRETDAVEATPGIAPAPSPEEQTSRTAAEPSPPAPPSQDDVQAAQAPAAAPPQRTASAAAGRSAVSFAQDTYVANESDGSVRLIVRRNGSSRNEAAFRWTLKSDSAEAGADFAAIGPGRESLGAGVNSIALTIPLVSDAIPESTELFRVELSAVEGGAVVGELSRASVIIVDDD